MPNEGYATRGKEPPTKEENSAETQPGRFVRTWIEDGEEETLTREAAAQAINGYFKDDEAALDLCQRHPNEKLIRTLNTFIEWREE